MLSLLLRVSVSALVGLVFVMSGILKLIDPVGTSLKMVEYFNVFGLSWLDGAAIYLGAALSILEFTLGMALMLRIRLKNLAYVLLAFMAVFTPLTAYLAFAEPIQDCGCFGEAVHLSNTATFVKNIVLLLLSVFIFLQRRKFRRLSSRAFEWGLIGFIAVLGIFTCSYSYYHLPPVEFSVFNPGKYMEDVVSDLNPHEKSYETTFVYEKDGVQQEFTIDEMPDESWTYVSSQTMETSAPSEYEMMPLPVMQSNGEYITEILKQDDLNLLLVVIYSSDISDRKLERIAEVVARASATGMVMPLVLCSADDAFIAHCEEILNLEVCRSDYKSLITLNRSNGGMVLVGSGEIITKWSVHELPKGDRLEQLMRTDAKVLAVQEEIHSKLFWEILAVAGIVIILIVNSILYRYNVRHNIVKVKSDEDCPEVNEEIKEKK